MTHRWEYSLSFISKENQRGSFFAFEKPLVQSHRGKWPWKQESIAKEEKSNSDINSIGNEDKGEGEGGARADSSSFRQTLLIEPSTIRPSTTATSPTDLRRLLNI